MLKQRLQQKLLQKLSPQQIQFIKLLQIPTAALDTRIKDELEENPALEDLSLSNNNDVTETYNDEDSQEKLNEEKDEYEEFNINDYLQDDQTNDYNSKMTDDDSDEDQKENPLPIQNSFLENLEAQLQLVMLDEKSLIIGKQLIGSLDNDGYLRRPIHAIVDDLAFSQNIFVEIKEVKKILDIIQSFTPSGIGARTLQECLLIQLKRKKQTPTIQKAILILEKHIEEFKKKHYDKLEKLLSISSIELKKIIDEILKLNPKPGDASAVNNKELIIIPDFYVTNKSGLLLLTLNSKNAPELHVSRSYQEMFDHYAKSNKKDKKLKEAVQFVKQKLDAAKWFITAIKQRQQTLLKTMNAIINYQYDYFITGDEKKLRPMILRDISSLTKMDISTISRVANSKYIQTDFGTFLLKSFFSEAIQMNNGEEVSNKEVKKILLDCIKEEKKNNPFSDDKLTEILKQKGYNIARRTVAKYREELHVPVARLRKKIQ